MKKKPKEIKEYSADEIAERKAKRKNIVAFAVCALIAAMIWLIIMNLEFPAQQKVPADTTLPEELFNTI